jgi:hypothetical protein
MSKGKTGRNTPLNKAFPLWYALIAERERKQAVSGGAFRFYAAMTAGCSPAANPAVFLLPPLWVSGHKEFEVNK